MDKILIGLLFSIVILITYIMVRKYKGGIFSKATLKFDPKKKLWYKSSSVSLEDIWANNLEGDNIFSPLNSNYYINVIGLDDKKNIIFSSSWFNDRILREKNQPLSNVKEIHLSLATGSRSVVPIDALNGLSYH
jgi:hypothetical protein